MNTAHLRKVTTIDVRVRTTQQLFDARDPSPFRERDLDDDFVEYLLACVAEHPLKANLKIVLHIEEKPASLDSATINQSIQRYFLYQANLTRGTLRAFLKRAQLFLVIGLATLFICLTIAQTIRKYSSDNLLLILSEGVVIFGWVSLWKPIELMMFDWIPILEKSRILKKISSTEIDTIFGGAR
ncbi:MAG: hypothetical protein HUU57_14315 [Bdellovibrio sp.]|nr:hypothetical protein [Bdellovibrio sp.]